MTPFPFRFYGARWESGAPHQYEVRFAEAPAGETRLRIAAAFETTFIERARATEVDEPWLWAGDWSLIQVGWNENGKQASATQGLLCDVLRGIHEVAPLLEVVCLTARQPARCAWTEWSRQQQPVPSAAPEWVAGYPYDGPLSREQPRFAATPASDSAFEDARVELRRRAEAAGAAAQARAAEGGEIALVAGDPGVSRPVAPAPPEAMKRAAPDHDILASPDGSWGLAFSADTMAGTVFRFADGGLAPVEMPRVQRWKRHAFSADGKRVFLPTVTEVYEYDSESREATPVMKNVIAQQLAAAADGTLLVRQVNDLYLYAPALPADDDRRLRTFDFPLHTMALVRGGRVLILANERQDPPTLILGLKDHNARSLGTLDAFVGDVWEAGGRVHAGEQELVNLDAAYERAFAEDDADAFDDIAADLPWDV